jgi:hypothetical protein
MGRLAARISSWTTRLLLTVMILVAALAVGRQTIEWWRAAPPIPPGTPSSPDPTGIGDPSQTHVLQLGDSPWVIVRQTLSGTEPMAAQRLASLCREVIDASAPLEGPPTDAERRFLASLEPLRPEEERPGQWTLYRVPGGFPVLVGVRPAKSTTISATQRVAVSACRVVIWAVATPTAKAGWSLYVFYPEKGIDDSKPSLSRVPVPPGTNQTLGIRVLGGGCVMGFQGPAAIPAWTQFYDRWFSRLGWSSSGWESVTGTWRVHYRSPSSDAATTDIRIGVDRRGQATGLIVVSRS